MAIFDRSVCGSVSWGLPRYAYSNDDVAVETRYFASLTMQVSAT
ncbi:hypothetical protein QN348_01925 [Mucilaginibacter sp. 5C4]|nr:hypothetical protein [Mucilaginibacter sp. 5C4]